MSEETRRESLHDKRVIFVKTGVQGPYPPLEEAIISSLSEYVTVKVCHPIDDLVTIASQFKPHMVLALHGLFLHHHKMREIQKSGIPIAIWITDDPYYTDVTKDFVYFDHIFTVELSCVDFYKNLGHTSVTYLPLGCRKEIFRPLPVPKEDEIDICFVGSAFQNRVDLIDGIADYLLDKNVMIVGQWWERLNNYNKLKSKIHNEWQTPESTAYYYNRAKIVLNIHRLAVYEHPEASQSNSLSIPALSMNNRTFEINGCKTLQISDFRADINNHYENGKEIVTFSTSEELINNIEYYLQNEEERYRIARSGFIKTLTHHTYQHRVKKLLNTIFD
ncbi:CgeB family protein [Ornithinibacillus californiensis]|uniref:CgeB family protein n=1 Tax=Ornithinibacillus californiensis TaxID=161536 RepID=UPI00069DF66C|nr:glycosyltransferase [Ornithinibacillus californiensis]